MSGPLYRHDITIPDKVDHEDLIKFFQDHCKHWCFQLECGEETGYIHYQCRISLNDKMRCANVAKTLMDTFDLEGCHVSPTNNNTTDYIYVTKEETRLEGPWSDKDFITESKIPKRFRGTITWKPFQQSILNLINTPPDDRHVHIVVDSAGNHGKSFFVDWLAVHKKAAFIPQMKEARDIMRMVMNKEKSTCYFIDFPRATSHNDQHAIYSSIETIKRGYAYDDRYHFKDEYFEPPHIWVFTNKQPDISLLSKDRWIFHTIDAFYQLQTYVPYVQQQQQQLKLRIES